MSIIYKHKNSSCLKCVEYEKNCIKYENVLLFSKIPNYQNIVYLNVNFNKLTSLPELPTSLKKLDCYFNRLNRLPKLLFYINRINCQSNKLTSLPKLPNLLKILDCSCNKLIILPELPNNLEYIDCENNNLIKTYKHKYFQKICL